MTIKFSRKTFLKIHTYLGLVTGLVVFIVSLTGALWIFKYEVETTTEDFKEIVVENKTIINTLEVKHIAQEMFPNKSIHGAIFGQADEAIEVVFYEEAPRFYQSVFINPYSGEVLAVKDHDAGFFAFMLRGHTRLWLPKPIGGRLVAYSILAFLLIMLTGLYLWWPKNKNAKKQRLSFQWKETTKWKRKNFDLHTILGFYVWTFAWILGFTGCVMAFNWFYFITYKATGGNKDPRFVIPNSISHSLENRDKAMIDLLPYLKEKYPTAISYEIHYPDNDTSSILVENVYTKENHYDIDYLFFDQNTLEELETNTIYGRYRNTNLGDKVIRVNYDLHVGTLWGLPTKIIMFVTSLLVASLPLTGFLIWWGRGKLSVQRT